MHQPIIFLVSYDTSVIPDFIDAMIQASITLVMQELPHVTV